MIAQNDLSSIRVAVIATDGFEQVELTEPVEALEEANATVHIIAPEPGRIRAWKETDWGEDVPVDRTIDESSPAEYDALLIPGGVLNPDKLRMNQDAIDFTRKFFTEGKPVFAICHGPQLLVECDVLEGKRMTSYASVKSDMRNAGAHWVDEEVVVDNGLTTSRSPKDLPAFIKQMLEALMHVRDKQPTGQRTA